MMKILQKFGYFVKPLFILLGYWFVGGLFVQAVGMNALIGTCVLNLIIIVLYVIYVRRNKNVANLSVCDKQHRGNPTDSLSYTILMILLFMGVWFFGQITGGWVYENMNPTSYDVYQTTMGNDAFAAAMLTLILAPIAEEILVRHIVYLKWRNNIGLWFAVFGQALVFAVMHGTTVHFIGTFMFALLQVLILETTGSLKYCIFSHVMYNACSLLLGGITVPAFLGLPFVFGAMDLLLVVGIIGMLYLITKKGDYYVEEKEAND